MMTIPWKNIQRDIKNALSDYDCKVAKVEQSENPDGSVFCDFRVTFKNPDDVADWDEVLNLLERDEQNWGWTVEQEWPSIYVGIVFQHGF